MARRREYEQGGAGNAGYEREPLVCIDHDSNSWGESRHRKSLPTRRIGSRDMDRDSPLTPVYSVPAQTEYYLDCDDDRARKPSRRY